MDGSTAINASSRKKESPIHISFSAECFGTQSALNHQGLNHVIDLTTPSPPLLLETSEFEYSPMSKPFEDTRTTSPTLNKSKDTVAKTSLPLPHDSSRDVANPDQYTKRREKSDPFFSATRRFFSDPVKQALNNKAAGEYINHQISKKKCESQYSRDCYQNEKKLQLVDAIDGHPQTCRKIARRYTAAFKHDIIAETLMRHKKQFAALDLNDQARVIKSHANIALPHKKPIRSEFWATVMQAPADISKPSKNPPKRKSETSLQDSANPIPPQTHARKDFWAIVMQTSEDKPSSEKVARNKSSGPTVRTTSSTSRKERLREEPLLAAVQNSALSTSPRKRPRRDFWAVCSE
ncbi:uncharacterized protein Bfra_003077 [Botrytis fragariae]|uniref:Uncharacterized protein n=1 Tax=Botrytis fragariae TaxID=1964551 RepID=A0A8H6AZK0_9HELO|nr:uncharacterized protein Bfra_003077 [Botrytis fragariae]KAF5876671.1 hypothetical protein Bfra_003077 [Botrytis fragariae]